MSCKIVRFYAGLLCSTTLASPVFAQAVSPQQTQQQIQELQQQNQQLQDRLNDVSNALRRQQQDISALKTAPQQVPAAPGLGEGWKVGIVGGRPTLYSADGQNSIALVGRFQFDVGEYFQSKAPGPTPPDFRTQKDLNSGFNLRRARLGVTGTYAGDWKFDFVTEFGNLSAVSAGAPGSTGATLVSGSILTASLSYTGIKPLTFVAGYTDVDGSFAEAVSSADITFNERPAISNLTTNLDANEPRAAFGVKGSGNRWYAAGYVTGSQNTVPINGQQAASVVRGVYLPVRTADALLHLGVNGSYVFNPPHVDANQSATLAKTSFTFSDRPELRIDSTQFLNTGPISAAHADTYGAEIAGGWKSLWFDGEYQGIGVDQIKASPAQVTPAPFLNFRGYYAEAGYFLTEETRPYSSAKGAWTTVQPARPFQVAGGGWGAWEIAARYSYANLNSGGILGGKQAIAQFGINWYPVTNVRFLLDYLNAHIAKTAQVTSATTGVAGVTPNGTNFQAIVFRTQVNW
jgi:phosphate-selective porin OprO and OprP